MFGSDRKLRVLVARDGDDALVGIAPLMIDGPWIGFIGQRGGTRAEYFDFCVRRGCEPAVTAAFCGYILGELREEWTVIRFDRVLESSPNMGPLERLLCPAPVGLRRTRDELAPYLELPGSWDDFLATRPKKFRNQWRNSRRRLRRRGRPEVLAAGENIDFDDAFEHLARLNRSRWADGGESFRTPEYLRFHRAFGRRMLERDRLCLLLLCVDGQPVAANYDFVHAGKVWGIQGGWDPAFAHERVGALMTGEAIAWAIRHGQSEYDFLGGNYPHKRRWASGERRSLYLEGTCSAPDGSGE